MIVHLEQQVSQHSTRDDSPSRTTGHNTALGMIVHLEQHHNTALGMIVHLEQQVSQHSTRDDSPSRTTGITTQY